MKINIKKICLIIMIFTLLASTVALCSCVENVYKITYVADGKTVGTQMFTVKNTNIYIPSVPEKAGYTGEWENFTLKAEDMTVNAVYTPIVYTVTFKAGEEVVDTRTYAVENKEVDAPQVPAKVGYSGEWEKYELTTGDLTVNAVYAPIEYTVTFKTDNKVVDTQKYTVENRNITVPQVPEKEEYDGVWENYTLTIGDVTVNAKYKLKRYDLRFVADNELVSAQTYTVQDKNVGIPKVPVKVGYVGAWEEFELTTGDITVNAIYTAKQYTVSLDYNGATGNNTQQSITVTFGQEVGELPAPTKVDSGFVGWYYGEEEVTSASLWSHDVVYGEPTLFAVWRGPTQGLRYTLNSDGKSYSVTGIGTATDVDIVIPSSVNNGIPVTDIGHNAFEDRRNIKSIVIPDSVESIGAHAFNICTGLTSIIIPESVKSIGIGAFSYCSNLTDISIADSVESIGDYAFSYCSNLTNITLSNSVISIGYRAFYSCGLTTIRIPNSVKQIADYVFEKCQHLESITFYGTVDEWNNISKGGQWNASSVIKQVVCTDGVLSLQY